VAWLCQNDQRSVPSLGGSIALGWVWPGVAGDTPRPWWRIEIDREWVSRANEAIAAVALDGRVRDANVVRRWADAFFAAAPAPFRERIYSLAQRKRLKLDDQRLHGLLAWWADLERESRNRRAHNERDDSEIDVTFEPRFKTKPAKTIYELPSIGVVAMPPKTTVVAQAVREERRPDEEVLAGIDAQLAAVDEILARFVKRP
jgi:hypothetical protein